MFNPLWGKFNATSSSVYTGNIPVCKESLAKYIPGVVLTLLLLVSPGVYASERINFDIPPQQADTALTAFARQSELTLIIPFDLVRNKKAKAVIGEYSLEEAIKILLDGTGLQATISSYGQLKISRDDTFEDNVMNNNRIKAGGILAFIASAFSATPGLAQEGQAPSSRTMAIEEVVVTAQRREESLQVAPVAVSALSSAELEIKGIKSITDLMDGGIPTLRISPVGAAVTSHSVSIRGITPADPGQISREQTVGIYLDGVYLGRAQGLGIEQMDLERLEVLRGPQGTLFGRNTVGGAINMVSKKPTGELGFEQKFSVGNYDYFSSTSRINLPRFLGISTKIDYLTSERDGWVSNPARGQDDWSAFDKSGTRVALLWDHFDHFTLEYSYDNSKNDEVTPYLHIGAPMPGAAPLPENSFLKMEPGRVSRARTGSYNEPSTSEVEGHSLTATWDLNENNILKSISAYRELEASQYASSSATFRPGPGTRFLFNRLSLADVEQDQFSQELQWFGSTDRLEYIVGAFYFKEDAMDQQASPFGGVLTADGPQLLPAVTPKIISRDSFIESTSKALFGQVTWNPAILDDRLKLTVGARYTDDKKTGGRTTLDGAPAPLAFTFSAERFDPAVTVAFQWNDNVNTYAKWSTAYRGGGVNSRSTTFDTFAEDEISSWELGLKSQAWDNRLRLNLAAYIMDWDDQQLDFVFVSPTAGGLTETVNAKKSSQTTGLELDLTVIPLAGLSINANYAYMDVDFPPQPNPVGEIVNLKATQAPRHAGSLSFTYDFEPFAFGNLQAYVGMVYSDDYFALADSLDLAKTNSYRLWNARITLNELPFQLLSGNLEFALWGKNLTDEEYEVFSASNATGNPVLIDHVVTQYNTPRTYGIDVNYRF